MCAGRGSIALISLCFLVVLSGCGGGGSGASGGSYAPPVTGTSSGSQASPTPSPSPYSQPAGTTFAYAGTLTQTFQSYPEVVAPGTPLPEPTSVTTVNVTQQITLKADQAFNGGSGLTDYHDAETDAQTSGLKTTTSTTDTFETVAQSGSMTTLLNYGTAFSDEAGDTMTTEFQPQRIEDELPETAGAQWANTAGAQVQEAIAGDANGSPVTVQRNVANTGTYSETTTYPPGYQAIGYTGVGQIQENSDGSGSYAWVAEGNPLTIEYSMPVPQPSGPALITIAEFPNLGPTPSEAPEQSFQLATWYGISPSFYGEVDKDLGTVPVPASCGVNASFPQSAIAIQETTSRTDTIVGYTEQEVQTSYVAGGNVLCTVLHDVQNLYYDFNGDQAFVFAELTPLEITTVDETLGLQAAPAASASAAALRRSVASSAHFSVAPALRAHFNRAVEMIRRHHIDSIARALAARHAGAIK